MVPGKRFARRRRDGSVPRSGFPRASHDAYGMGRPANRPARIEGGCWPWATTRTRKPPVTAVGRTWQARIESFPSSAGRKETPRGKTELSFLRHDRDK